MTTQRREGINLFVVAVVVAIALPISLCIVGVIGAIWMLK